MGKLRFICLHSLSGWYLSWSNVMSSIPAVIEVTNSSASFEDFQKLNLMIRKFNVGIVLKNLPKY